MTLLPISSPRSTRRLMLTLVARHRAMAVMAAVCLVGAAGLSLVTAPLLGSVVDLAVAGDVSAITDRVLLLAGAALAQGVLAFGGLTLVARLGELVLANLREDFVAQVLDLPLDRIEAGGSGDLTSRVTEDVAMISQAVRTALPDFVQSALVLGLTLVGLAALDWRFGVAALLAVPIQVATARWYVQRSGPLYASRRVAVGGEQQQLFESIGGAGTVRAFRLNDEHVSLVGRKVDTTIKLVVAVTRMQTRFFGRLNSAELVGLSAVLIAGFLLVQANSVTIGAASAAALYFANLFGPINSVLFLLDTLQSATASLARLLGVITMGGPVAQPSTTSLGDGSVKAVGLRHSYVADHEVLHGIDLDIPAGSTVALVGASGGGKTTLAKLLAGVHEPTRGTVHIGGTALSDMDPTTLRRAVVLVTQEVHVFAGSLADDLRLARPSATEDELRAALDTVGWRGPELDTVVGDGGHELTVMQAQQVALARLILADPLLAILDEATAEAGSSGARVLEAAAKAALRDRTGIVVAHRLTQAATADLIIVLDHGRIVEHGTHNELVTAGGRYARLWAAWSANRD
nr:ABC transporter ATP-binding protein [Kibdelosporangium sp. MJ126-NF4]CEL12937.1 ABC transporter, transmembrane region:ABC transporter [Kibdelosporangium sp. MJ126-NF4]CTQ98622.1 ABC transporter, transmembrane region:ABC transporter [Kibdelosporangium sp. MJ126-NF4]